MTDEGSEYTESNSDQENTDSATSDEEDEDFDWNDDDEISLADPDGDESSDWLGYGVDNLIQLDPLSSDVEDDEYIEDEPTLDDEDEDLVEASLSTNATVIDWSSYDGDLTPIPTDTFDVGKLEELNEEERRCVERFQDSVLRIINFIHTWARENYPNPTAFYRVAVSERPVCVRALLCFFNCNPRIMHDRFLRCIPVQAQVILGRQNLQVEDLLALPLLGECDD